MTDDRCNCPPIHDVFRHGVTTKPPCPVHPPPEAGRFVDARFPPLEEADDITPARRR